MVMVMVMLMLMVMVMMMVSRWCLHMGGDHWCHRPQDLSIIEKSGQKHIIKFDRKM